MAKRLELYYDLMSQPSRTLYIFFNITNLPFTKCPVAIRKGEHLAEEFTNNVNRFQRLPCINDNGFKLSESVAIARYICREYKIADHWYPKDSKLRARVDEYLEWQHLNTRANCALLFRTLWINTKIFGKPADPKTVEKLLKNANNTLDIINNVWLKDQQYIAGNEISIADLFAATEILQTITCDFDPSNGRPQLKAWLERVKNTTNPHFDEAHKHINALAAKGLQQSKL